MQISQGILAGLCEKNPSKNFRVSWVISEGTNLKESVEDFLKQDFLRRRNLLRFFKGLPGRIYEDNIGEISEGLHIRFSMRIPGAFFYFWKTKIHWKFLRKFIQCSLKEYIEIFLIQFSKTNSGEISEEIYRGSFGVINEIFS